VQKRRESCGRVGRVDAGHLDSLVARPLAGQQTQLRARHAQRLRKLLQQRLVGAAFDGRGGNANTQSITMFAQRRAGARTRTRVAAQHHTGCRDREPGWQRGWPGQRGRGGSRARIVAAFTPRFFLLSAATAAPTVRPHNDTFLRALLRQPTEYTPLWLMRQAGRYLPEYRATRARAGSFLALAKSPALATEVTLQPLERYRLDAAILFSDILTVPDAMGLGLYFADGEGPKFERPIRSEDDVARLAVPDPEDSLRYVMDAVREIRRALADKVPLIGFSGSPFTLACYMVEGGGSEDFRLIKTLLYSRPELAHRLLALNARAVADYLNAQIRAGAQAVMIFDTWGGALPHAAYLEFSLPYMAEVVRQLQREHDGQIVPRIVFTKGGAPWLKKIADIGCDAVGLDWTADLGAARATIGDRCALQGNLDPMTLLAGAPAIQAQAVAALESFGTVSAGSGHVFNLGHGILQQTPPDAIEVLVETVHRESRRFHVTG
jgi:uroporphyrinogen decarboxylase